MMHEDLPREEICFVEPKNDFLPSMTRSTHQGDLTAVVLYDPDGTNVSLSFRLEFPCSHNKAEYETLSYSLSLPHKLEFEDFGYNEIQSSSFNKSMKKRDCSFFLLVYRSNAYHIFLEHSVLACPFNTQ